MKKQNYKKILYSTILFCCCLTLFGCGKNKEKSNEVVLGNSNNSSIYNNLDKEDSNFNEFEEKNDYANEMTNTTELDVIKSKDKVLPSGPADSSSANVSGGDGKMTPEEAEEAIIEEEYECDYITFGEEILYIPLTKGFKLANESATFKPEIGEGVTTLSTNDKNTGILKIRLINDKNDDYFWNYLDETFNNLSTNNNVSGLKQSAWKEEKAYDFTTHYSGLYWNEVANANVIYYAWEICWINLGDVTLFAEFMTNNENEKVNIENVAKEMFPAIIYINEIAKVDNSFYEEFKENEESNELEKNQNEEKN